MKPEIMFALFLGMGSLNITHAEGGCPPGWMPYSGTSINSCGPIPGYNNPQQRAAPRFPSSQWESRWGAIVTDGARNALGVAAGMVSKEDAEQSATADCRARGGTECRLQISYANGCGVMVVGDKGFNASNAVTLDEATEDSLRKCRADDDFGCHVYYSACSPPVRLR